MTDFSRCKRLNDAFQYVDDEFLDIVEQEKRAKRNWPGWARYGTVAACICLLVVLSVSSMADDWYGIMDLLIPDSDSKDDLISLSGYQGSPEAEALREWHGFLEGYDTDHKILDAIGNDVFVAEGREDWGLYGVYSYEMGEKLDEIADKYGLKLHHEVNIIDRDELMYRVGGSFMDTVKGGACLYEDGSFRFEGDAGLDRYGTIGFQLTRKVKGTFDEAYLGIGQPEDYEEWQYITSCGEPVLLGLGPHQTSLIFADYEECFVSVNVLAGIEDGLTEEGLQELADQIDFSILKNVQVPDMRGDTEWRDGGL